MFDKFLHNPQPQAPPEKRKAGRPPKPDHERKRPKRVGPRFDEHGRVKKEFRKRKDIAGRRHWKSKAKRKRVYQKARRHKTEWKIHRKHQASLRRKYNQNRSVSRLRAVRKAEREGVEVNLDEWYQLTYAEWVVMWLMAEDVYHPDKGLMTAVQACGNPVKNKNVTYADRLDKSKPFTKDNMAIFWNGKALGKKNVKQ